MTYDFRSVSGPEIETDGEGLTARTRMGSRRVRWHDVVAAGCMHRDMPIALAKQLPVPGFAALAGRAERMMATTDQLWIVSKRGLWKRMTYLLVPKGGSERDQFVGELRMQIGPRWTEEPLNSLEARRRYGLSNWWVLPVTILVVLTILAVLFALLIGVALVAALIDSAMSKNTMQAALLLFVAALAALALWRFLRGKNPVQ